MSWPSKLRRWCPPVIFVGFLILLGYWVAPKLPLPESPLRPIPALPQHPQIRVAFNQARSSVYTDPYRHIARYGDDLEAAIAAEIAKARQSVAVAIQELNLPRIALALADRQQAGVSVRLITENTYARDWSAVSAQTLTQLDERDRDKYREFWQLVDANGDGQLSDRERQERDVTTILKRAGVPWINDTADGSLGSGLMHHKFAIVDGRTTVAGSANFTLSDIHGDIDAPDSRGNANHILAIDSPELAAAFTEEFDAMWGDGPGREANSHFGGNKPERPLQTIPVGDATIAVHFSPAGASTPYEDTTGGAISQVLGRATQTIDLALFVFSDATLAQRLEYLHEDRRVEVRGVFDPGFAFRDYSGTLDLWGIEVWPNCQRDPERHPWSSPLTSIGTPALAPTDKLHHKFALVDAATPQATVITGSHNWSSTANRTNDESLLAIASPVVAAHFAREFDRLYSTALLGAPQFLVEKMAAERASCESTPPPSSQPLVVNLNRASLEELERLPGIGPSLAERIVTARPIRSLQDLDAISGIGPTTLDALRRYVTW